jgi:DNA end-binding protein Ku
MARAIWTGSLSFGLVNVPVGLFPATQDKAIHFNQFESGTSDRIRYKRVNERSGEEVPQAQIVKGYDLGGGEYVMVTDDELSAADPERSRTIGISDFVDASEIDPLYYRAGYYLAPQGEGAQRAYALLRHAMAAEGKVAVANLVMRNKEYLVTIRPDGPEDVLVLQTMFFPDEVRSTEEQLPNLPHAERFDERELAIARQLIDAMSASWLPDNYHDTHRERVQELVESKRDGREIVVEAPAPAPRVVDLMAALEASVKAAGGPRAATPKKRKSSTSTEPAAPTTRSRSGRVAAKTQEPTRRAARKKAS